MSNSRPGTRLRVDVLTALMAEREWKRADLAREASIPESSVGRLLDGKMRPTGLTIAQIMRAFPRHEVEDLFDLGRERPGAAPECPGTAAGVPA